MKAHLIKHHTAMAKLLRDQAESMDDGHEAKTFLNKVAAHHEKMCKALSEASNDVDMPGVSNESRRGGNDLVPTKARRVFEENAPSNVRLVPRAGGAPLEKSAVPPGLEEALDI